MKAIWLCSQGWTRNLIRPWQPQHRGGWSRLLTGGGGGDRDCWRGAWSRLLTGGGGGGGRKWRITAGGSGNLPNLPMASPSLPTTVGGRGGDRPKNVHRPLGHCPVRPMASPALCAVLSPTSRNPPPPRVGRRSPVRGVWRSRTPPPPPAIIVWKGYIYARSDNPLPTYI